MKTKMVFNPTAPHLKGLVQSKTENPDKPYNKIGEISLWKYTETSKTRKPAPSFKGHIEIDGIKYNVSLWYN
jgi:hypothetical protein